MQEMTAELSRLKIEKVALEERNKLLEKVLSFKQQGQAQPGQGQARGQLVSLGKAQRCHCVRGWKLLPPCLCCCVRRGDEAQTPSHQPCRAGGACLTQVPF